MRLSTVLPDSIKIKRPSFIFWCGNSYCYFTQLLKGLDNHSRVQFPFLHLPLNTYLVDIWILIPFWSHTTYILSWYFLIYEDYYMICMRSLRITLERNYGQVRTERQILHTGLCPKPTSSITYPLHLIHTLI